MSCPCEKIKREMPKCEGGTPPVLEINSVEAPVLFHTITIPASIGDETTIPPTPGAYRNARVFYEADNVSYLYDSDGIPQVLSDGVARVTSVNGQTGNVVLSAADLGAQEKLTAGTSITISNRNVISAPPVDTVLSKTSPNPISNSAVATAIDTITTELDRTVVYDLEMDADAESVSFTEDKVDVVTGITSKEVDTIPTASATSAGTISAADFRSITYSQERLDALENGSVAIANLPASPSQTDLTNAWLNATGYDELINRASIFDITNSKVWTYYTNILLWEETPAGAVTVNPFTNSTAGTILGSNVDGNISANVDGTGSVAGWSTLVGLVNTKGEGDMKKSTYDTNNNGIVDNSEKVNNHTVNDDVPANVFSGQATGTVSGTELTISNPVMIDNVELKGDTDQTTYSGVQLVTKQGMATPTSDTSFWNFISGDIAFTPLTDGWGRFVQTNSGSTIYGNLFANYSSVDLDLDTDYTIIFEFKNITATSGTYDIAQRTASADPFETLSVISGCTYSGTNISVNMDGSNTFAVFKGHTKTTATTMSIRTFTRPNFPIGKGFDVRVSYIKGDHSSDWQNYCGDNYQPFVGGTASPNPDYPQEVQTVTGRQVVTVAGKNMLNLVPVSSASNGITTTLNADGSLTCSGTATDAWADITERVSFSEPLSPSDVLIFSVQDSLPVQVTARVDIPSPYLRKDYTISAGDTSSGSGTVGIAAQRVYLFISGMTVGTTYNFTIRQAQLEKSSTPTPYVPYNTQTYEVNLGKNLLDKSSETASLEAYFNVGNVSLNPDTRMAYIPCLPNTTYTVSRISGKRFAVATTSVLPDVGVAVSGYINDNTGTSITITTNSSAKYLCVFYYLSTTDTLTPQEILDTLQIEKGSTATTYAPYFTPIELCKIGDYQDYIYKSGDDWYVHKEIGEYILNGSLVWYISGSCFKLTNLNTELGYAPMNAGYIFYPATNSIGLWCNYGIAKSGYKVFQGIEKGVGLGVSDTGGGGTDGIYVSGGSLTLEDFRTMLNTSPLVCYYALATPTDTKITDSTLIGQLNDLMKAGLYDTTEITVDGSLPAILNVTYFNKNLNGVCEVIKKIAANS